jgi:hypothetical protein
MRLLEWPLPEVNMICKDCGHEMSFDQEGLKALFGEEADMSLLRIELASGCVKGKPGVECWLVYKDALLVNAILANSDEEVLEKSLLPQAREWRKRLGLDNSFRKDVA